MYSSEREMQVDGPEWQETVQNEVHEHQCSTEGHSTFSHLKWVIMVLSIKESCHSTQLRSLLSSPSLGPKM